MTKLPFKPWMIEEAREKAQSLGSINNSITKGGGNIAGYLAEIALNEYIKGENLSCSKGRLKYDFDLLKGQNKIEVKTKRRTVDPEPHYEVSIATTSEHQRPDFYAFISITFAKKRGKGKSATYHGLKNIWLCGFLSREEFFSKAKFIRKGELDPSNGFICHQDMYNLPISKLDAQIIENESNYN